MGQGKNQQAQLVNLAPSEVRGLLHPREGFERFARDLATLYRENEDVMRIIGFDPDALTAEISAYDALETEERDAFAQFQKVQRTRLLHGSNAWAAMLEIYDRARSAGRTNPDVMRAIASFAAFMKNGRRKKTTPVTTPHRRLITSRDENTSNSRAC